MGFRFQKREKKSSAIWTHCWYLNPVPCTIKLGNITKRPSNIFFKYGALATWVSPFHLQSAMIHKTLQSNRGHSRKVRMRRYCSKSSCYIKAPPEYETRWITGCLLKILFPSAGNAILLSLLTAAFSSSFRFAFEKSRKISLPSCLHE